MTQARMVFKPSGKLSEAMEKLSEAWGKLFRP
jgi:hypothetical protein